MKTTLLIPAALLATLAVSRAASIFTAGHGDIGIAYEAGVLEPHVHVHDGAIVDGAAVNNPPDGEEYAPGDILIFVSNPSVSRVFLRRRDHVAVGITYTPQVCDDLAAWQPVTATPEVIGFEGEMDLVRVPLPAAGDRQFLSVKVTMP